MGNDEQDDTNDRIEHLLDLADDPKLITDPEEAAEVIDLLTRKMAAIEAQIEVESVKNAGRRLPPDREDWVHRASYARSMMAHQRHKVIQREKSLRRGDKEAKRLAKNDPAMVEAKRLKQERLMVEAEARRQAKAAKAAEAQAAQMQFSAQKREMDNARRFQHRFHEAARKLLPPDLYKQIRDAAGESTP